MPYTLEKGILLTRFPPGVLISVTDPNLLDTELADIVDFEVHSTRDQNTGDER
jgi:hypothetical protein